MLKHHQDSFDGSGPQNNWSFMWYLFLEYFSVFLIKFVDNFMHL